MVTIVWNRDCKLQFRGLSCRQVKQIPFDNIAFPFSAKHLVCPKNPAFDGYWVFQTVFLVTLWLITERDLVCHSHILRVAFTIVGYSNIVSDLIPWIYS